MTSSTAQLPTGEQARHFSQTLLSWHRKHGRTGLPWQKDKDPYRVWISEVMLQQTQVSTVIPYYERFTGRFPTVNSLAEAEVDEILSYWSGLGYYARAHNLHRAAQRIVSVHDSLFPDTLEAIMALPGVGRSTAGAILAFCFNRRTPILDGNVQRTLTRYLAIQGNPGDTSIKLMLWAIAERLMPTREVGRYTQAIMDFGATVCTRSKPDCSGCPLNQDCKAYAAGNPVAYPTPRRRKPVPVHNIQLLLIENQTGQVLLQRRPDRGIWGGLWSLPEVPAEESDISRLFPELILEPIIAPDTTPLKHRLTHYELRIELRRFRMTEPASGEMSMNSYCWYNPAAPSNIGLPAAINRLLAAIEP